MYKIEAVVVQLPSSPCLRSHTVYLSSRAFSFERSYLHNKSSKMSFSDNASSKLISAAWNFDAAINFDQYRGN